MLRGRLAATAVATLLGAGSLAVATTPSAAPFDPVAATVPGEPAILRADVARLVAAATSPGVASQFTPAEVGAQVLTELVGLDLDRAVALRLGVAADTRSAAATLAAAERTAGGPGAYQQQLIRSTGAGWAGADVYTLDAELRTQLAAAESTRLTPVPAAELQAEYDASLGTYEHAHVQVITTPDEGVAARDAALARADPARFPALARADTDDDAHRASGGDYGPTLARGQLYRQVDDAVFAAAPGAVLGPIAVAQARPEYYVVRVLSLVDIPLSAVTARLVAEALDPAGPYVQGRLAAERQTLAAGVAVAPDLGRFMAQSLRVVPPDASADGSPG